jgi:hypothetical protein
MRSQFLFRARASAIHASASVLAALLAACLVFLLWYPWPYRVISGGTELFLIVMGVDVILGPLITLAIFDPRKARKELWRDMVVVVIVQLAALGYGLHTVYVARPVVLALEVDRFRASNAAAVQVDELPKALPAYQQLSLTGPVAVNTEVPAESDAKFDAIMMGMAGADLGTRPSMWRPWDAKARQVALKAAKPLAPLVKGGCPGAPEALCDAIARTGRPIDQLMVVPMLARRTDWSVLLDKASGDIVGFAPIDTF